MNFSRFWAVVFLLIGLCSWIAAIPPALFFTDLEFGPSTGGEGGVDGAFVCAYGENFGGSPRVTIGGTEAFTYKVRRDSGPPYLPGHYAKVCGQISHLTPSGAQSVLVVAGGITSNSLTITVRSGRVYFAAASGSDRNPGASSAPFATLKACKNALSPGDISC
jgi:hypothetical protein